MDLLLIFKAILSLIFVLGLLMLTLWGIKYLERRSGECRFFKNVDKKRRLEIIETKRLDTRNTIYLIRRDNTEHLLLIGTNSQVVESNISTIPNSQENKQEETQI